MRTFVLGDIHGENDKLVKVLSTVNFDFKVDRLISLGDLTDRGKKNWEVLDTLRKVENKILVRGNHDEQLLMYLKNRQFDQWWLYHGGTDTMDSYEQHKFADVEEHIKMLETQVYYYVENNICFVHGGFDKDYPIQKQSKTTLVWDRELVEQAMSCTGDQKLNNADNFDTIFIGHTPTTYWSESVPGIGNRPISTPVSRGGVINMDTGSGKGGKLTLWQLETGKYIQE